MGKSLTNKVKNYILFGGLVGALTLTGCESMREDITPAMAISVMSKVNAMKATNPDKARAWAATSDFADKYGARENALDAAREGKTVVIVNGQNENKGNQDNRQNNNDNQIKVDEDFMFVCSGYTDKNNDGMCQFDEFSDFKADRLYGKYFYFILYNTAKRGDIRFVIKNESGKIIREEIDKDIKKGSVQCRSPPPEGCPYGTYTGWWYRDEVLLGVKSVEYLPPRAPPEDSKK